MSGFSLDESVADKRFVVVDARSVRDGCNSGQDHYRHCDVIEKYDHNEKTVAVINLKKTLQDMRTEVDGK